MRSLNLLAVALAVAGSLFALPARASYIVKSDGPVISHMCGLKSDPTACHWCTKSGCYVVYECHNGYCTINKSPPPPHA